MLCGQLAVATAVVAADGPVAVGQELTLDGLGVGAQTVYGARGAVDVAFPPAVTPLAATGSFVRIFFSHSADAGAGSTMLIAVNGQPLLTVPLTSGTAGGGVVETRLTASLLDPRQPNRLQVRFTFNGPAATLYGRIAGPTLLHYELAAPSAGPSALEQYPYSLLTPGSLHPQVGLVLPPTPDAADLSAAFRVMADLGRRAASQHVSPHVVTADQFEWLAAGGVPAVLVGPIDDLPAARPVLEAARWTRSSTGWVAPGGEILGSDEGVVMAAVSPWDHRSPLLLVTGATPTAVARAASGLVNGGGALSGQFVVVSDAAAGLPAMASRAVQVSVVGPRDLASFGAGRYRAAVGFAAPAVDPQETAILELTVPAFGAAVGSASVEVDVNGSWVGASDLDATGARSSRVVTSFPARLLRPGRNALSLEFRMGGGGAAVQPAQGSLTTGADTATAAISLPDPTPSAGDLRLLPFPFMEGGRPLRVVLADGATATLGAAAQAVIALGSRSTMAASAPAVTFATGWDGSGAEDLLVVGRPPAGGALEAIGAQLPVVFERSGDVTVGGRVRLSTSVGAVEELATPDASSRQVLWLAGTDPDVLMGAAASLYDPSLSGAAAVVDATGRVSLVSQGGPSPFGTLGPSTAQLAAAVAAVLILAVVALQLLRPRRVR